MSNTAEEYAPQLSWLDFLETGQMIDEDANEKLVEGEEGAEMDGIEGLRKLHKTATAWPFPFDSSLLERQYLEFSAPAVLVPPLWSLLFLLYIVNAPAPDFTETGEWCPLSRMTIQVIQWGIFSITLVAMLLQCTKLWLAWRGHTNIAVQRNSVGGTIGSSNAMSPSAEVTGFGDSARNVELHLGDQENQEGSSYLEAPQTSPNETKPGRKPSPTTTESAAQVPFWSSFRLQGQFGSLYLFFRTVVLYSILLEAIVRDIQLWRCWAPTKYHDVDIMSSSLMHFSGTLILHGSLKWDIPRFLLLPLINTILSSFSSTQAVEDRFAQIFALWIITFIFLCIAWDAERESRSRFLLSKALEVMRMRSDQQRRKVAQTLRSICDEDQLQMYLTGIPLRDESPCCYILILSIHDYVLWRQQNTIVAGMACVDFLQREVERQRQQYPDLSLLCVAGDETIVSLGLRAWMSASPNKPSQESGKTDPYETNLTRTANQADPSNLVLFAFQTLSTPRMLATKAQIPAKATVVSSLREELSVMTRLRPLLSTLALRVGLGYGPCQGALVPGRGAHYIIKGTAFDSAQEALVQSLPGTLDLALPIIQSSHVVTVIYRRPLERQGSPQGQSSDSTYVRVTNIRRKALGGASHAEVSCRAEMSGAEDIIVGDSLSPTAAAAHANRSHPNSGHANASPHHFPRFLHQPPLPREDAYDDRDAVAEEVGSPPTVNLPFHIEKANSREEPAPRVGSPPPAPTVLFQAHTTSHDSHHLTLTPATPPPKSSVHGFEVHQSSPQPTTQLAFSRFQQTLHDSWEHIKVLFHPVQDATYYRFVDRRLLRRGHFINACWFAMSFVFNAPLFNEVFGNLKSVWILTALECTRVALWLEIVVFSRTTQPRPSPPPFFRWQIFCFGISQFALLMGASMVIGKSFSLSFAQNFPSLHCNLLFSMTSIDGIPLMVSLATAIAFQAVTASLRTQVGLAARILSFLPTIVLPIIKASLIQSEYKQLVNLADRQRIAENDRQAHEAALNKVIPSYIASHVAKMEARGGGRARVVSEVLLDVAMLLVRFPASFSDIDPVLDTLTDVQRFIESFPEITLISTDGDVMMISGPLARPPPTAASSPPLSSTKRFFHFHADRFVTEGVANRASESVLRALRYLEGRYPRGSGFTAVLHRGDGVAVVFQQQRRPVFAVEGVVAEVARSVLQHIPTGVVCVTERFAQLYPGHTEIGPLKGSASAASPSGFLGMGRDASPSPTASPFANSTSFGISTKNFGCLRIKGVGFINVYVQ